MYRFDLDGSRILGITTDNASSNYAMTRKFQEALVASGQEWNAAQNHIPCMAHVIQLVLGAFMASLGIQGRAKSWAEHEREKQTQCQPSKGKVPAKKRTRVCRVEELEAGFHKIIEKVCNEYDRLVSCPASPLTSLSPPSEQTCERGQEKG
jgi:hypothetical protein